MPASKALVQAIAVAAELTGTQLSAAAARVMADDLSRYQERQVLVALERCRREVKGRLSIADVVSRLDDGRPGPEEAWAMVPITEEASVVWTEEMRQAFFVAYPLVKEGDLIPARMAFLEHYRKLVQLARDAGWPVEWTTSLGTDKVGRELVLLDAAEKGRISPAAARALLPHHRDDEGLNARLLALTSKAVKRLGAPA